MRRASHVLFNTFNQDFGCFVCGLDDGFRIYNTDPLKQNFNEKLNGGIGAVEMLFRCNYVALVGGGVTPAFSTNKVVIWDIINHREVVHLEMNSDVRAVRLRRDRIVVVLDTSVHIFSFTDQPEKLQVYDSSRNPRGICCLCPASEKFSSCFFLLPSSSSAVCCVTLTEPDALPTSENSLLAFPAPSSSSAVCCVTLTEPDALPKVINAHQRPLSAIALNLTGEQLATSSEKGTIIRIFDTKTCLLLKELRRGTNPASIYWYYLFRCSVSLCSSFYLEDKIWQDNERIFASSISFSTDSTMLCVSSNHHTVHLFSLAMKKKKVPLGKLSFSGEVSVSRFRLPFPFKDKDSCICAFGPQPDSVIG
ncbi:hypothetical protein LOAG_17666 [Loa loa]|uniref:WD repeat domain phosphoinositide-interacting protein 3 n=1 Tax=Loa loa TaxID=7209 RepID=A0A1S0UI56_LOALO|nr:hypothetical protein LOAG_17666 [Loa loa]EJD75131.1 hypothetical protein LOAG_17666 [Loa loa]